MSLGARKSESTISFLCPRHESVLHVSWGFRSMHVGGAHFLLVDGSVRFISQNINYATYQNLGSRNDGNNIGEY